MEIKCNLCGEKIAVIDDLVPGQHVRCPFCNAKFTYALPKGAHAPEEMHAQKGMRVQKRKVREIRLQMKKGEAREIKLQTDEKRESLARRKMMIRLAIVCGIAIVVVAIAFFQYSNWCESKDRENQRIFEERTRKAPIAAERNQRREGLRQYVSGKVTDLRRQMSDIIGEINGVSRKMRDCRDAGEDVSALKAQKAMLRQKQDAIQEALNTFLSAGLRIESMDFSELDAISSELAIKAHELTVKLAAPPPQEDKTEQKAGNSVGDAGVDSKQNEKPDLAAKTNGDEAERCGDVPQGAETNQNQIAASASILSSAQPDEVACDKEETSLGDKGMQGIDGLPGEGKERANVVPKSKLRKCYRCFGRGTIVETVNEKCEDCDGRGFFFKEVTLKDTQYSTYGGWNYKSVGTRVSKNRQYCSHCKHRGKITVKKERTCKACDGCGYFTKDGVPCRDTVEVVRKEPKEISQWLIPTAQRECVMWRYVKARPEGLAWTSLGFDHAKWFNGGAAFAGKTKNLNVGTKWDSQDICLRKNFRFEGDPSKIKVATLCCTVDDTLCIWLNGEKICERSGIDEKYREINVMPEMMRWLRKGDNVIAAWAHDCGGRRNVDIGLFVRYEEGGE